MGEMTKIREENCC